MDTNGIRVRQECSILLNGQKEKSRYYIIILLIYIALSENGIPDTLAIFKCNFLTNIYKKKKTFVVCDSGLHENSMRKCGAKQEFAVRR